MKKKTGKYERVPRDIAVAIQQAEVVNDFLPPPEALVLKDDMVKVTLNLSQRSVDFLKEEAATQGVRYQQMVRKILDLYTEHYARE